MTSTETGPSWSERLNPRNWTLAWKLLVVGLVPALLALGLGVLRIADQASAAGDIGRNTRLLEVRDQVAQAADALRQERHEATLFVAGGRVGDRAELDTAVSRSDDQFGEMQASLQTATELEPGTVITVRNARAALDQLSQVRRDATDDEDVALPQVRERYSQVIQSLEVLDRALLRQLRTPGTAGLADSLTAVQDVVSAMSLQHTIIADSIRATQLLPNDANEVNATTVEINSRYRDYQATLSPEQLAAFGTFLDAPANATRLQIANAVLGTPPGRPVTVDPVAWDGAYVNSRGAALRAAESIRNEITAVGAAAEERASNLAGINSVILMLGLLIGITIAILVARSLIRSLRVLRTSALDVAERRLPLAVERMRAGETTDIAVDPVPLDTRDEVGQVARAFDAVHGQAVRVAADQAAMQVNVSAMFVNLSRRSQALVERQLQLIEQLESNEQDADQLSNLFQLDHLATRMRRNSENLLVLAGTDLAKRNIAPVPLVDVLRAAVSEIEQYQRIVVQAPPTATIVGRAASDLVHLLAELLDNATNFSPPDSQVVMSTARTADGSIVVEIADRGVGMADHEVDDANRRLVGGASMDVSASRRMGLFVVGRLAARHGVGVHLSASAAAGGSGLTASVTVPAYLVPSAEPVRPRERATVPPGPDVPGQRTAGDGGRSLSAYVAGTDGPANPAGGLETGSPLLPGPPPGTNGSAPRPPNGLPTRRPGSTLRPAGPPRAPKDDAPSGGDVFRTGDEVDAAAQAAADQESARLAEERSARNGTPPRLPDGLTRPGGPPEDAHHGLNGRSGPHGLLPGTGREDAPEDGADTGDDVRGGPAGDDEPGRGAHVLEPRDGDPADADDDAVVTDQHREQPREGGSGPVPPTSATSATAAAPAVPARPDEGERTGGTPPPRPVAYPTSPLPAVDRPGLRPTGSTARSVPPGTGEDEVRHDGPAEGPGAGEQRPEQAPGPERSGPSELPQRAARPRAEFPSRVEQSLPGQELPRRGPQPPRAIAPRTPFAPPPPPGAPPQPEVPQQGRPARSGPTWPAPPVSAQRAAAQPTDGLFAPGQPDLGDPADPRGPGSSFERGETTPIFEEIASAWFRSNRPLPVEFEEEGSAAAPAVPSGTRPPVAPPTAPAAPPVAAAPQQSRPSEPPAVQHDAPAVPVPPPPAVPEPTPAPPAAPAEPVTAADFASSADAGWRAANESLGADQSGELTAAGLPKRRPRARLVPGSAGSAVLAPPVSPARSAENIRGRLASYQQGVRQGRERRNRGDAAPNGGAPTASTGVDHDEESS